MDLQAGRWAVSTKRRSTSGIHPCRIGTERPKTTSGGAAGDAIAAGSRLANRKALTAAGPIAVHSLGPRARRIRVSRRSEKDVMHTRSTASGLLERFDERVDDGLVLGVDVPAHVRPRSQQLVEAGDGLVAALAEAHARQGLPGHLPDQSGRGR